MDHQHATATDLPLYPTTAPESFSDPVATADRFRPVLAHLAEVVEVGDDRLDDPTPCAGFTIGQLRRHVLAWLQFFAAALTDPSGGQPRLDTETWEPGADRSAGEVVREAAAAIERAIGDGVAAEIVTMSQARMAGDGVLAMALGEYLVHGWDLAVATGHPAGAVPGTPQGADRAAEPALAFLRPMVQPEHRGPDSGFFDVEVEPSPDAGAFERLLCFAGRDPAWQRPGSTSVGDR